MDTFARVRELKRQGLFSEALSTLLREHVNGRERIEAEILRMELLETIGEYGPARSIAQTLASSRRINHSQRSSCEYVLGRICTDLGPLNDAVAHFQRAALFAQDAKDIEAEFHSRIQIFNIVFERVLGYGSATPILADVRALATKLGDGGCTAKLHLFVGVMEARRGLLSNAKRHLAIARRLLQHIPNAYLEAFAENMDFGLCLVQSDFDCARTHAARAVSKATSAGLALMLRAATGNLGHLCYATGDFERAIEYFQGSVTRSSDQMLGQNSNAALEGLARVFLAQGRLSDCREALDAIGRSVEDRQSYFCRDAELTRALLLGREERFDDGLNKVRSVIALATQVGDTLMCKRAALAESDFLERSGRVTDALTILESVVPTLVGDSPELFAHAEQTFACAAIREGDPAGAAAHRARAARICDTIGSVTAGRLLDQQWQRARHAGPVPPADPEATAEARATARALHAIASAVAHSARPRLAADELKELLVAAACVDRATVTSGPPHAAPPASPSERFVEVGIHNDDVVGISLARRTGANAAATVTSIQILANAIRELELARAEREERATLWPVDELPIEGDASVISGHMRELMTYARKIAKTKVNVLITGESGTGKEILARAIHTFSDRAHKPFVPFNCTAIPRDLLESQLFGHRRGAFTGADRDHLGLIRSAREGTLFLDEIGELGLDLQPKLLRFLESGEIAPLGEPEPKTIDVRIIAATNTQLEDAVRAGRFREDLFYRLNVVRLSLRPLRDRRDEIPGFVHHFVRRAADEFNKGRITVTEETMERLLLYRWPGNVRQLQNEVRRIVALAEPHATITPDAIDEAILGALPVFHRTGINGSELSVSLRAKLLPTIARIECEMIKAALHEHKGRVNAVAKALGISRKGLYLKRQRFGL